MDAAGVVTTIVTVATGLGLREAIQVYLGRRKIPAEIEVQAATATHERSDAATKVSEAAARMVENMERRVIAMQAEHHAAIGNLRQEHDREIQSVRAEFGRQLNLRDKLAARHRPWDGLVAGSLRNLGQDVPPPPPLVPETYDDTDPGGTS